MKVFQGKPVRIAAAIVLAALVLVLCIWHKCTRAVWCNLTVSKIELDDSADWDGGTSYTRIPYAEDSDSQYLDLYVPGIAAGETPKLFVIIHGGGFIYGDSQTRQAQFLYRYFRDRGYACATVNYRLAQEEPFPGGVCDCKAAIRFCGHMPMNMDMTQSILPSLASRPADIWQSCAPSPATRNSWM